MANTCYIIGAVPVQSLDIPEGAFVICADAGIRTAERFSVKPDLIVGDFDSLGSIPQGNNVVVHPVEKDETDSLLAIRYGIERGYDRFVLYGCLGGRLDHTLANIQHLQFLAEQGMQGILVGENEMLTAVKNKTVIFDADMQGGISVLSLTDKSEGVTIRGLYYEAENITLTNAHPLAVSNRFCGKPASIRVKNGVLLIVTRKNADD